MSRVNTFALAKTIQRRPSFCCEALNSILSAPSLLKSFYPTYKSLVAGPVYCKKFLQAKNIFLLESSSYHLLSVLGTLEGLAPDVEMNASDVA